MFTIFIFLEQLVENSAQHERIVREVKVFYLRGVVYFLEDLSAFQDTMSRYSGGNASALLAKVSSQLRGGPSQSVNSAANDDEDIGVSYWYYAGIQEHPVHSQNTLILV
jgi:hypothetical protein